MALRNAFDGLATENGLRRIANLLTFARDAQDRIRMTVDVINSPIQANVYARASTSSVQQVSLAFMDSLAWNLQDARETQRVQMAATSALAKQRWTY